MRPVLYQELYLWQFSGSEAFTQLVSSERPGSCLPPLRNKLLIEGHAVPELLREGSDLECWLIKAGKGLSCPIWLKLSGSKGVICIISCVQHRNSDKLESRLTCHTAMKLP